MGKRRSSEEDGFREPLKMIKLSENSEVPEVSQNIAAKESVSKLSLEEIRLRLRHTIEESERVIPAVKRNQLAWENSIVDAFKSFVEKQQQDGKVDYIFTGRCVEAAAKQYVLKLDILYEETRKLCFSLGHRDNQDKRELKARGEESEVHGQNSVNNPEQQPAQLLNKKKRKHVSTVVKNPENLNAKLITNPTSDPFFSKLNATFVGDSSRANRMILNLMPSKFPGHLGLSSNAPFWDSSDQKPVEVTKEIISFKLKSCNISNLSIRSSQFIFSDDDIKLATFVDLSEDEIESDYDVSMDYNENNMDTSEIHPLDSDYPTQMTHQHDTAYGSALDTTQMNSTVDDTTINNTTNMESCFEVTLDPLEPPPEEFIESMEPLDGQQLEYSFRPMVKNFFAGPSHWKYIRNRESVGATTTVKTRKRKFQAEVTLEDMESLDSTAEDILSFGKKASKKNVISLKKLQKMSAKSLQLPTDFQISPVIIENYENASFSISDTNYINTINDNFDDTGHFDDTFNEDMHDVSTNFSSLKRKIRSTTIIQPKRARRIDIKAIKNASLVVLQEDSNNGEDIVKFSAFNSKLTKMFEDVTSCALNFYCLLAMANEKKIDFIPQNDSQIDDFSIHYRFQDEN